MAAIELATEVEFNDYSLPQCSLSDLNLLVASLMLFSGHSKCYLVAVTSSSDVIGWHNGCNCPTSYQYNW